ncbi:hypothetical protein [Bacillus sp. FSL E2-8887]|uniref:hypothetical protein n=1 Tax=Bacillus sp. FSL E2-8887 TaxID=2954599 RepID=UPI0030F80CA6
MRQVIKYIHEMLWDIAEPLGIDVYYKEASEENIALPYMVFDTQSDMALSQFSENFTININIWGVDEHYQEMDDASQGIMEAVVNRTLIDNCKPLVIHTKFLSRMDIPVDDLKLRCKEVRFTLRHYRRSGQDTK